MTQDLNALIERLESLADLDARAGEPLGKCMREAAQALRDRQPVRDEEVQSRVLHSALISSFDEWTEPNEAATDLEAIRSAMRRYLPPDSGITAEEFASEVIGIIDRRGK